MKSECLFLLPVRFSHLYGSSNGVLQGMKKSGWLVLVRYKEMVLVSGIYGGSCPKNWRHRKGKFEVRKPHVGHCMCLASMEKIILPRYQLGQ